MSRVYQRQTATATNRATAAARSPQRQAPAASPSRGTVPATRGTRGATRGGPIATRGRVVAPQPPQPTRADDPYRDNERTNQPERTVHVGFVQHFRFDPWTQNSSKLIFGCGTSGFLDVSSGGYQMFTPSTAKREQMRRQAENEQREYEAHVERSRLRGLHEVHRLGEKNWFSAKIDLLLSGGDALSEEEVRRRQAEKYRLEKFARLVRSSKFRSSRASELFLLGKIPSEPISEETRRRTGDWVKEANRSSSGHHSHLTKRTGFERLWLLSRQWKMRNAIKICNCARWDRN